MYEESYSLLFKVGIYGPQTMRSLVTQYGASTRKACKIRYWASRYEPTLKVVNF